VPNNQYEIFGQRLTAAGAETGTNDFRMSDMGPDDSTTYSAVSPAVASDPDGEYLVVWHGDDTVDSEFEIWGQRLSATGTEVGDNDFRVSQMGPDGDPAYEGARPALAVEPTPGQFLAVWDGDDAVNNEYEIYGRRLGLPAPILVGTDPASPANNNSPKVKASAGSVDPASTIDLFTNTGCSGTPSVNDAPAGDLIGSGIQVSVPDNSTTSFTVTSSVGGRTTRCSNSISYTEQTPPPPPPPPLPSPPPPPVDRTAPVVSGFSVVPAKVRPRKSSSLRFRLSEPATARILIERVLPGRRVGKRCVAPTRKNRGRARCTRFKQAGTLTFRNRPAGQSKILFRGRIGKRVLLAGSYRATITATDAAGNRSRPKRASFKVLRR
jgi:hypothetical protein